MFLGLWVVYPHGYLKHGGYIDKQYIQASTNSPTATDMMMTAAVNRIASAVSARSLSAVRCPSEKTSSVQYSESSVQLVSPYRTPNKSPLPGVLGILYQKKDVLVKGLIV